MCIFKNFHFQRALLETFLLILSTITNFYFQRISNGEGRTVSLTFTENGEAEGGFSLSLSRKPIQKRNKLSLSLSSVRGNGRSSVYHFHFQGHSYRKDTMLWLWFSPTITCRRGAVSFTNFTFMKYGEVMGEVFYFYFQGHSYRLSLSTTFTEKSVTAIIIWSHHK